MNYTQAQIDRANAVSLEDFLRTQGETLIKSGREYRWKEHDSLTVRGNKWFRHSQSKGGYPIDFVMEFYGKSFPEAVQLLTGESGEGQTEATTAPPTAFHLPLHNRTADRAIQYLCESRGLNPKLVEAFLLSGDIYEQQRHKGQQRSSDPENIGIHTAPAPNRRKQHPAGQQPSPLPQIGDLVPKKGPQGEVRLGQGPEKNRFSLGGRRGKGCSKGTLQSSVHVLSSSRNASLSWVSSLPHLR